MKILVTGSMGFISRNLIEKSLLKNNKINEIIGIDHVDSLISSKKYNHFKIDLSLENIGTLPNNFFDVDIVIHTAGIPSPKFYKKEPFKTIYLNYDVTKFLLNKIKHETRFVYFSSSEIYGNPDSANIPTKEEYNGYVSSIGDRSCYDESKRLGETVCYLNKEFNKKNTVIIRPFNFYGSYMKDNDNRIIPRFVSQTLQNKNITVFNNGEQTRSYCYIDDAVKMISNIIFNGKHFVYNVGNNKEEITANKLAEIILSLKPNNLSRITRIDYPDEYPKDEPLRRCPNIDKYIEEFDEEPLIDLKTGLQKFYLYAKANWK